MKGKVLSLLLAFCLLVGAAYFSSQTLGTGGIVSSEIPKNEQSNEIINQEVAGESVEKVECSGKVTPSTTEGPYYKANAPKQIIIAQKGTPGKKLTLSGYVLDRNCVPISNALLDFWQADNNGEYDNIGFNLRGQQNTNFDGKYSIETIIPAEYENRTPHIHVKVSRGNNTRSITTQLFIPGVESNSSDEFYNETLLIEGENSESGMIGKYNFVIE